MSKRTYNQYCGFATALDLLGERWTLLILRMLLHGPKRFKDLESGLPGIGTGLLTQRLKQLQHDGIIERSTLPPPAGSSVYQLTSDGEELRGAILELTRWGLRRLGPPDGRTPVDPDLMLLALEARFEPKQSRGADGVYALHIDDSAARIEIRHATITIRSGAAEAPRATLKTDSETLALINNGQLSLIDAVTTGRLTVDGDVERVLRLGPAFGLT